MYIYSMLSEQMDHIRVIKVSSNMSNFMRKPNLLVHLEVTPEESMER